MKRLLALALVVFGLAACQNDPEVINPVGGEVDYELTVAAPELGATRANANMDSAKGAIDNTTDWSLYDVRYILEIYNVDGTTAAKERMVQIVDKYEPVVFKFRIVPDRTYKFVVFADFVDDGRAGTEYVGEGKHHIIGNTLADITISDDAINDECTDGYFFSGNIEIKNSLQNPIELTRPYAKLRVVTTDLDELNLDVDPAKVVVTYAAGTQPTTFNAITGVIGGANAAEQSFEFEYKNLAKPYAAGKDAEEENMTLFADYILATDVDTPIQFKMDVYDENNKLIKSNSFSTDIPVRRNYLTTIIGNVLTTASEVMITIDDDFSNKNNVEDKPYYVEVWDGKKLKAPKADPNDPSGNTLLIGEAAELAWLAASVNGTLPSTFSTRATDYSGKTYKLTSDIDLYNNEWTPIGTSTKAAFRGSFDGQGYTISNFKVTKPNASSQAALFGTIVSSGTFKNLTIDNVTVLSTVTSGETNFYGAGFVATIYGAAKFEGITIQNSRIQGSGKTGALIGFNGECAQEVKNCHAINCVVESTNPEDGGNIGGLVGFWNCVAGGSPAREFIFENCSVVDGTINAYNSTNSGKRANSKFLGGYNSAAGWTLTIKKCSIVNTTLNQTYNGGDVTYENPYESEFVGGERNEVINGEVYINGTLYKGTEEPKTVNAEDGEWYATISEAIEAGNKKITLGEGTYTMPATIEDGAAIEGNGENTILDMSSMNGSHYNNVTFSNLTINENVGLYNGIQHSSNLKYEDCTLNGTFFLYADSEFTRCTFNIEGDAYNVWTYGATETLFKDCTFNCDGKSLLIYNEGYNGSNITLNNCVFNSNGKSFDGKAAVEIDSSLLKDNQLYNVYINECTVNGFAEGSASKSVVYNPKKGTKANVYVDGVTVWVAGYSSLANYPNVFTKDGEFYVFNAEGLMDLNKYFEANKYANDLYRTYNIAADINAEGYTWNGVYIVTGYNGVDGLILNGNNHTISNLTINHYLLAGTPNGGDEGTKPGVVKNITMDNITVNGSSHDATVFWGDCYGDVDYENVIIKNSTIKGGSNVGALMSRTTIDNANTEIFVNFKNCKVVNCSISANDLNADPTGASGFVGRAYGKTHMKFDKCSVDAATEISNIDGLIGGRAYGYGVWKDGGWKGIGASDSFINFDGVNIVETDSFDDLTGGVNAGDNVTLTDDVEGNASSGGYNKAGFTHNGGVLDGGGNELIVNEANTTWDCAIYTNGGTIKNFSLIGGSFRGIFTAGTNNDIYIDNVTIDKVCYTFNSDGGNKQYGVYISNSTLNGWTSYSDVHKEVVFTNCKLGKGTGGYKYAYCRPYAPTVFENCEFEAGYELESNINTVIIRNCKVGGITISQKNIAELLGDSAANAIVE